MKQDLSAWLVRLPTAVKLPPPESGVRPVLTVISLLGTINNVEFTNIQELMRKHYFVFNERSLVSLHRKYTASPNFPSVRELFYAPVPYSEINLSDS
ncbi:hypothetical protein CLV93_105188 [Prolixibacter denitrificans]|uniref:Uncharacterized protein n=1 Tax=Prolixibacter denitrificans TaxID=1541063 RepID=A0A2P8CCU6_9BACT|nr:hypothetical protein CLV93_105188 [Prolixibacter denitrificans]